MTRVVLDTNVIISGVFWRGASRRVFRSSMERTIVNCTSVPILEKVRDKMLGKFGVPRERVWELSELLIYSSDVVWPAPQRGLVKADPDDDKIVACAIEAEAGYIVSDDSHLLDIGQYGAVAILTPHTFLRRREDRTKR